MVGHIPVQSVQAIGIILLCAQISSQVLRAVDTDLIVHGIGNGKTGKTNVVYRKTPVQVVDGVGINRYYFVVGCKPGCFDKDFVFPERGQNIENGFGQRTNHGAQGIYLTVSRSSRQSGHFSLIIEVNRQRVLHFDLRQKNIVHFIVHKTVRSTQIGTKDGFNGYGTGFDVSNKHGFGQVLSQYMHLSHIAGIFVIEFFDTFHPSPLQKFLYRPIVGSKHRRNGTGIVQRIKHVGVFEQLYPQGVFVLVFL